MSFTARLEAAEKLFRGIDATLSGFLAPEGLKTLPQQGNWCDIAISLIDQRSKRVIACLRQLRA